jgi:hypothetical protein
MPTKTNKRGGARDGAGRKPLDSPPTVRGVRCTDEGWEWLQAQALGKGHTSVGKWADAKGRKAPERKGNDKIQPASEPT